jgi:hypothetical protein
MKTAKKMIVRILMSLLFVTSLSACQEGDDNDIEQVLKTSEFDFDQFGKTHNAYLTYVWNIEGHEDAEKRFNHGLTFTDPTFGSFNVGLRWEDISRSIAFHERRVESILAGSYDASSEKLSPAMTSFLNELAASMKLAVDRGDEIEKITVMIESIESRISQRHEINIDLVRGISNDGASMMAICAILKYSLAYWTAFEDSMPAKRAALGNGKIKRALADAWGYVSAWVNNGDGSYSWSHSSALVNADCVSDSVRPN